MGTPLKSQAFQERDRHRDGHAARLALGPGRVTAGLSGPLAWHANPPELTFDLAPNDTSKSLTFELSAPAQIPLGPVECGVKLYDSSNKVLDVARIPITMIAPVELSQQGIGKL